MSFNNSAQLVFRANPAIRETPAVVPCSTMCIALPTTANDAVTTHCNGLMHRVCLAHHVSRFNTCPACGVPLVTSVGVRLEQAVGRLNEATGTLEIAANELKKATKTMEEMVMKADRKKEMKQRRRVEEYEGEGGS
jgi:hypothetical protein